MKCVPCPKNIFTCRSSVVDLSAVHRGTHRGDPGAEKPLRRVREGGHPVPGEGQQLQSRRQDHQEPVRASEEGRRGFGESSQEQGKESILWPSHVCCIILPL